MPKRGREANFSAVLRSDIELGLENSICILIPDAKRSLKKPYDFHFFYKGRTVCVELKQTQTNKFDMKNLAEHQLQSLLDIQNRCNVLSLLIILYDSTTSVCVDPKTIESLGIRDKTMSLDDWEPLEAKVSNFMIRKKNKNIGKVMWDVSTIEDFWENYYYGERIQA